MLMMISVGNVWADPIAATLTAGTNGSAATVNSKDAIKVGTSKKSGDMTITVGAGATVLTLHAVAWSGAAGNISLSAPSGVTLSTTSLSLSANSNISGTSTDYTIETESDYLFNITLSGVDAETEITLAGATSSGNAKRFVVWEATYETGSTPPTPSKTLESIAVSGTPTKTAYYAGDEFDPAGLVVTGTYSDETQATISSGITWAYDPSQELALNQTSIGVIATVSEIASPKFNVTGLTVTEVPAAATYEKVTSTANITDGDYLIVYEDGNVVLNGALTSLDAVGNTVAVTINDGVITGSVAIDAATVTINTTAKTIQTASGYYIGVTSYSNGLSSSTSNAYEHQNISIDGGNVLIYFQQQSWNSNKNGKMQLCYNSGSDQRRFRYFKEGSQKAIQLYKKVDGSVKPSAELSYAAADQKKLTKLGETFTAPTLVNSHGVAVTYASSAESVAEVAANGAVTIKAAGVAVITASYDGSGDYKEGSASYTISVGHIWDDYIGYVPDIYIQMVSYSVSSSSNYGQLFGTWRSTSAIVVSSDKNKKKDIEVLDERYSTFFNHLNPVRFRYKDGKSSRYHTGLIAQEVIEALKKADLSESELAAVCTLHNQDETSELGIRYEELIALCVKEIQRLNKRVEELEDKK